MYLMRMNRSYCGKIILFKEKGETCIMYTSVNTMIHDTCFAPKKSELQMNIQLKRIMLLSYPLSVVIDAGDDRL